MIGDLNRFLVEPSLALPDLVLAFRKKPLSGAHGAVEVALEGSTIALSTSLSCHQSSAMSRSS